MAAGGPGRRLFSGLLVLHLTALVLGNLPWSPFIATLYPIYSWYLSTTGQIQNWRMYTRPDHLRTAMWLTAHFDDGRIEQPWGETARMSPRRLYVLETLLMRDDRDEAADRFLRRILNRYPADARPQRVELGLESWPTHGFDVPDGAEPSNPLRRTYEVRR